MISACTGVCHINRKCMRIIRIISRASQKHSSHDIIETIQVIFGSNRDGLILHFKNNFTHFVFFLCHHKQSSTLCNPPHIPVICLRLISVNKHLQTLIQTLELLIPPCIYEVIVIKLYLWETYCFTCEISYIYLYIYKYTYYLYIDIYMTEK